MDNVLFIKTVFSGVVIGLLFVIISAHFARKRRIRREESDSNPRHSGNDQAGLKAESEIDPFPFDGSLEDEKDDSGENIPAVVLNESDSEDEEEDDDDEDEGLQRWIRAGGKIEPGTRIDHGVDLSDFDFEGDVILDGVVIEGSLEIEGLKLKGRLSLKGATIQDEIGFEDDAEVGSITLEGATIGGECDIPSSKGEVCLAGASFKDDVVLDNEKFGGVVDCRGMKIAGDFSASSAEFESALILSEAVINGQADLDDATMTSLDISGAVIEDICMMRRAEINGDFLYKGAKIGGSLFLEESNISPFPGLTVENEIHL